MKSELETLTAILRSVLNEKRNRRALIGEFQSKVWNESDEFLGSAEGQIVGDLAYDLDYYEPDPSKRRESESYFDDERLELLINESLDNLGADR
jgi:hypothetical protein